MSKSLQRGDVKTNMYAGSAEESVECPVCATKLSERRPPFRRGSGVFSCDQCGTSLRFSKRSQNRFVYIVLFILIFGLVTVFANRFIGDVAGVIAALLGAVVAMGMLVWQGKVPQVEVDE